VKALITKFQLLEDKESLAKRCVLPVDKLDVGEGARTEVDAFIAGIVTKWGIILK
jgi:hypothetical protein